MKIKAYERFRKSYRELPVSIQRKVDKQVRLLSEDFNYSSLHTKKIKGKEGIWEARIDRCYRMTFEVIEGAIFLRVVGDHEEVLRNP